jgi:hypothetical protein
VCRQVGYDICISNEYGHIFLRRNAYFFQNFVASCMMYNEYY